MGKYKKVPYERSFAYYIIEELGIDLDLIWNWEKNNELGINPYEIKKQSNKKIWLYCLEHDYHNYDREGNKVGYETQCDWFYSGNRCGYCGTNKTHYKDSLAYKYPQIAKMIAIKENGITFEDCYSIAPNSNKEKYYFKCDECGNISNKKKSLNTIINNGKYSCEFCSDGLPITEKFMANILNQLSINYIPQLSKTTFEWCKDYRYDFYIPSLNIILETHGEQHYKENNKGSSWKKTLEKQQADDRYKKYLAKKNGIKRYYSIDCRYSRFEYMKKNIIKTLGHLFDLSNINWELAWKKSQKSKVIETWELWNNGLHSTEDIGNILNLDRTTVRKYLKIGKECGKCDYTYELARKEVGNKIKGKNHHNSRKIICVETRKIFNTTTEAGELNGVNRKAITNSIKRNGRCKGYRWKYLNINHNKILRGKDISKLHKINEKIA